MTLQDKINLVERSIKNSIYNNLPEEIYAIHGLTSKRNQNFLNQLTCDMNVLEIGSFCGASTIAMARNANHITTIDNWSNIEVESVDEKYKKSINKPKEVFSRNTKGFNNIENISNDIFSEVVFNSIVYKDFDIIFYDGPHDIINILKFIMLYESLFDNTILVFEDYNFDSVSEGIEIGFDQIKKQPSETFIVKTNGESIKTFWNGLGIFIFE